MSPQSGGFGRGAEGCPRSEHQRQFSRQRDGDLRTGSGPGRREELPQRAERISRDSSVERRAIPRDDLRIGAEGCPRSGHQALIKAARRIPEPDLEKFRRSACRTRRVSLETGKTCLSEAQREPNELFWRRLRRTRRRLRTFPMRAWRSSEALTGSGPGRR